ncbi:MAG: hypothetical protein ACRD2B_11125 [Terriglobia bacterium]
MDIERTMQFILETQAKLEARDQIHEERLARIEGLVEANATRIGQLVDVSLSLAHAIEETNSSVKELRDGFNELREIQAAGEYKLNALIDTVDKLVRRNGGGLQS